MTLQNKKKAKGVDYPASSRVNSHHNESQTGAGSSPTQKYVRSASCSGQAGQQNIWVHTKRETVAVLLHLVGDNRSGRETKSPICAPLWLSFPFERINTPLVSIGVGSHLFCEL